MEKTTRPTSICEKAEEGGLCLEDYISGLPDVILVSILSLLTMKEAGRTSLLSKRWRYMWTYITGLNFDASHVIDGMLLGDKQLEIEMPMYLSWVNQVVKSFNGPSIDEFRVQFDIDETSRFYIDNWVKFAMEKRVKSLELDFTDNVHTRVEKDYIYRITNHPHGFTSCNSLTILQLSWVNVSGQVLEYFLTNCPLLEQLSVDRSEDLVNLKVPKVSLKLKCLAICHCFNVESIEISAMNLMSFHYVGPKISLPFKNVPMPVDLYIGGDFCDDLIFKFLEISSYLSQLESLALKLDIIEDGIEYVKYPVFNKLKQLELNICARDAKSLLVFAPLIEACPFLSKFVLKLLWVGPFRNIKHQEFTSRPHQFLKVVELIGFAGGSNDVELAMYLIKRAINLEMITFDTCEPVLKGTPFEFIDTEEKKASRKRAKELGTKLPAGVALLLWVGSFRKIKRQKFTSLPHQYLKVVELIGFVGGSNDVELAMYLIKRAINLEMITFDTCEPVLKGTPFEFINTKEKKASRKRAKELGTKLPAGVALARLDWLFESRFWLLELKSHFLPCLDYNTEELQGCVCVYSIILAQWKGDMWRVPMELTTLDRNSNKLLLEY